MSEAKQRPELGQEWIVTAARKSRILGIAHQTLRAIPSKITPRQDDPKTFDIVMSFQLQTTPYKDDEKLRALPPEDHFREEVEAAVDANRQPLGFKIGTISVEKPALKIA